MTSYTEKSKHAYSGTATTIDVLKAFWRGMSRHKPTLFFSIFGVALARVFSIIIPIYYKKFFDILSQVMPVDAQVAELISIIIAIFGFNLVVWAGYRLGTFATVHFQARVIADLKQISFDFMIDHSYAFYANNFTGSLVQRVNRFARAFETLADRIVYDVLPLLFQISGVCIVLWFTNPVITYVLLVWIFIFLSFNYVFSRWKLKYDVKRASMDSFTTGVLSDAISNQHNIQLFTGSKFESKYFKKVTDDQATFTKFVWNLQGVVDTVQSLLIFVIEFLLFYFAIKYWQQGIIT
ncbi:MAG: ABC transporter transmembrane domain-containing protein, partial [bacterium]|nr:ABC transporter transmembrane domain-containing protein [bacterium]